MPMLTQAEQRRFLALLRLIGRRSVQIELDLTTLCCVVGALQRALRDPAYPEPSRPTVEGFLQHTIAALVAVEPELGRMLAQVADPLSALPDAREEDSPCRD